MIYVWIIVLASLLLTALFSAAEMSFIAANRLRLRHLAALGPASRRTLERWSAQRGMSARAFHRAWRVARTAADLDGAEGIDEHHVLEALGFRLQDVAA